MICKLDNSLDRILTLCRFASKSYSENILWTFIYFCAESAKINERPKFFSVHDFGAKRQRVRVLLFTYFNFAITVLFPTTLSSNFTSIWVFKGKNKSTREPNLMKPKSSPCVTTSPSLTYTLMRLAKAPAI
jgi:hypothetical protein